MVDKPNWLGGSYPPVAADTQIRDKLVELRVLESTDDEKASRDSSIGSKTPQTLQVITAGASQLSKWWIGLVGTGFGLSALIQGVVGLGWEPLGIESPSDTQQAVLTASAAVVAAALVIAIAVMVRGDVSSRALSTAAQYNARAAMTTALIGGFQYGMPAPRAHYLVTTNNGTFVVKSFGWDRKGMFADVEDGSRIHHKDFKHVDPVPREG